MNLKCKIIQITGGSSGIGLDLTRQLVACGNTVIITGRSAATPERAAAEEQRGTGHGVHRFRGSLWA